MFFILLFFFFFYLSTAARLTREYEGHYIRFHGFWMCIKVVWNRRNRDDEQEWASTILRIWCSFYQCNRPTTSMQFCQLCSFSRGLPSPGNKCIMPLLRNVLFIHVNFIQAIPNFEPKTHTLEFSNSITAEIFSVLNTYQSKAWFETADLILVLYMAESRVDKVLGSFCKPWDKSQQSIWCSEYGRPPLFYWWEKSIIASFIFDLMSKIYFPSADKRELLVPD